MSQTGGESTQTKQIKLRIVHVKKKSNAKRVVDALDVELIHRNARHSSREDFKLWQDTIKVAYRALYEFNPNRKALELLYKFDEHIIYEDDQMLILNKPAGVLSHYEGDYEYGIEEIAKHVRGIDVNLINELDTETSGIVVLSKTSKSFYALWQQFKSNEEDAVKKLYIAILDGQFQSGKVAQVEVGIDQEADCPKMAIIEGDSHKTAKNSLTYFEPLRLYHTTTSQRQPITLAKVQIISDHRHQIRVVAAQALGMPIVGDKLYNAIAQRRVKRQLLHASTFTFLHPTTGEKMTFTAPAPPEFQKFIDELRLMKDYKKELYKG